MKLTKTTYPPPLPLAEAPWDSELWTADAFASLLLESRLPRTPVVTAFRLCALLYPPPPVTVDYHTCDFCDTHVDPLWPQISHACSAYLLRFH